MNVHANPREHIGANNPPGQIEIARGAYRNLNAFLAEAPVITTGEEAKTGARWVEHTKVVLEELDAERRKQVDPLNVQVRDINDKYRPVRDAFTNDAKRGLLDVLRKRLTDFAQAEEAKRTAQALRLQAEAAEAERLAREAERQEQDAIACADVGELGIDIAGAIEQADQTFADFRLASRDAVRATKDVPVRFGSTLGKRSLRMGTSETLTVDDACAAIAAIGLTDKIRDAILSGARDYRRLNRRLPAGVSSTKERSF